MHDLDDVNSWDRATFVAKLGAIYEHSPWVAEAAFERRPFESLASLHGTMQAIVLEAPTAIQIDLIRAHPELVGRPSPNKSLTAASQGEQAGAGLNDCSEAEIAQLKDLNERYRDRFGFPFVVAVRGLTRGDIIEQLAKRCDHDRDTEFAACLEQIGRIAGLRLRALITDTR